MSGRSRRATPTSPSPGAEYATPRTTPSSSGNSNSSVSPKTFSYQSRLAAMADTLIGPGS